MVDRERDLDVLRRKLSDSEKGVVTLTKIKDAMLQENSLLRADLDQAHLDNQVRNQFNHKGCHNTLISLYKYHGLSNSQ